MRFFISVWLIGLAILTPSLSVARPLAFDEAIDIVVNRSSRGQMIRGDREVAERTYFAKKVGFWVPDISIRGSIPAYAQTETYGTEPTTKEKTTFQRTDKAWESYINLDQNLITGGKLTFRAFLNRRDARYTEYSRDDSAFVTITEDRNIGSFDLTLDQPILQPSEPKHELHNKKDDLEIARLSFAEDIAALKQEMAEVYFGVLQMELHQQMAADRLESARLQTAIDSIKFAEEVLSEEAWLESVSARLDAELEQFDSESSLATQKRQLAMLLDLESGNDLEVSAPEVTPLIDSILTRRLIANSDAAVPVLKAHHEFRKADRAARFESSSRGLSGTLSANFGKEKGRVVTSLQGRDDLNLNDWGVNLQFTYPIWDGGASGASVKAAELAAEKARIEYESAKKASRAEIESLINGIGISARKLGVLSQQIDLANNRLGIARSRFEDGQISKIKFLESNVDYLQSQNNYYEELKNYLIDTYLLEGKFSS